MMTSLKHFATTATRWNSETGKHTICTLPNALDVEAPPVGAVIDEGWVDVAAPLQFSEVSKRG